MTDVAADPVTELHRRRAIGTGPVAGHSGGMDRPRAAFGSALVRSGLTAAATGVVSTSNRSLGVHCSAVHNAARVSSFTCAGCLVSSADTDADDRRSPDRSARSRATSMSAGSCRVPALELTSWLAHAAWTIGALLIPHVAVPLEQARGRPGEPGQQEYQPEQKAKRRRFAGESGGEAGEVADVAQRDEPAGTEGEPPEQEAAEQQIDDRRLHLDEGPVVKPDRKATQHHDHYAGKPQKR